MESDGQLQDAVNDEGHSNKRQRTESDDPSKEIFVKITKTIPFIVKDTDSIDEIKLKVEGTEGITPSNQKLFLGLIPLEGTKTVGDYDIAAKSCLDLYVNYGLTISIHNGTDSLSLDVKFSDTVSEIEAMMRHKGEIGSDEESTFFFSQKMLHDHQTLGSCGVHNNAVLRMVVQRKKTMLIKVQYLHGLTTEVEVKKGYTVSQVKNVLGIEQDSLVKLFYLNQQLSDDKSLCHYKICAHSVLKVGPPSQG